MRIRLWNAAALPKMFGKALGCDRVEWFLKLVRLKGQNLDIECIQSLSASLTHYQPRTWQARETGGIKALQSVQRSGHRLKVRNLFTIMPSSRLTLSRFVFFGIKNWDKTIFGHFHEFSWFAIATTMLVAWPACSKAEWFARAISFRWMLKSCTKTIFIVPNELSALNFELGLL